MSMNDLLILMIGAFMLILFLFIFPSIVWRKGKKDKHKKRIRSGERAIQKVKSFKFDGQRMNYLKKMNPFDFEEAILSAFASKGFRIQRNKRYTGDGGIDGVVWINGVKHIVQAKRYAKTINPMHVVDLQEVLSKHPDSKGLFIHTGRTGLKSHANNDLGNIEFINGGKLLELFK
jgi:restriction system protein